ncbi:MAG: two-component system, NarL family, nitrate/nitrite sensor histidine kinase NarX [Chloroflexi bacterium]|nr:two-component system, NarL family, nitrate/nitrite sensor histidine kinase NarX [Chloroflexota bacterium]
MNNKIKFGILAFTAFILLILSGSSVPRTAVFYLNAPIKLYTLALAQSSNPPSQEPLVLTDEQGEYPLGQHMDILEDPSGELSIAEVASPEIAARFKPSPAEAPVYGYTDSVFWLRLRLRNEATLTDRWLLESNFQNLNYVDLYIPAEGGDFSVKQSGALRPFDTRDVPYYHVVFELPLAHQNEQTFYLRIESGSSMTLAFTLWSSKAFAVNKISDILSVGLFYGALLIMLGYHLFALYSLKEINYFYFVLVLASAILFFGSYEGVADQYLWPGWSQYKLPLLTITMAIFFMSTLKFGDAFLEQKSRAPRIHLLFNLMIGVWGLMIVIVPFFSFGFMAQITSILIILTPIMAAVAGFYSWRKGYHPAKFYLVSWLGFILGLVIVELVRAGILPSTPFTEKAYHLGLIWLVLIWSLALVDRIKQLEAETKEANLKLVQSEHKLSQTLEGLPIGVAVYGPERSPTYLNPRAIDILANPERGMGPDVAIGRTITEAMKYYDFRLFGSDQTYPLEKIPVWRAYDGQSASIDDIEANLIDRRVPLEIWANPVKDEEGKVVSVVAAFQDITERRQAQAELDRYRLQLEQLVSLRTAELTAANDQLHAENAERRRLEKMLRLRLEWLADVIQVNQTIAQTSDLREAYQKFTEMIKKLFDVNDAFLAESDADGKELKLLSHTCRDTVHPDLTGMVLPLQSIELGDWRFETGTPILFTRDQLSDQDGPASEHFQHTNSQYFIIVPHRYTETKIGLLGLEFLEVERLFSADEITLLDRINFDIAQVQEKARISEQTQVLIAAEERNRLARELHDSVTQVLFAASLVAEVLPQIWRRDPQRGQASLEELRRLSRGALAEMRTMLLELRPAALIKTPLGDLLAQLTEAITGRTGLPFQLYIEQIPPLPDDVHICFYRIAQESLNNVVKHAQASQVAVSLSATSFTSDSTEPRRREVKLMVRDNGRGFSAQDSEPQHLGLAIMHERAAAIHADFSVESQPEHGTTVTLTWHN